MFVPNYFANSQSIGTQTDWTDPPHQAQLESGGATSVAHAGASEVEAAIDPIQSTSSIVPVSTNRYAVKLLQADSWHMKKQLNKRNKRDRDQS